MMPWRRRAARRLQPHPDLTTCRSCTSEHVIPSAWTKQDESWSIHVRCGECGASGEVVVPDAVAQRYDRGMHAIARALDRLDRLDREAMAQEAEAFATALELDLVNADDFAR